MIIFNTLNLEVNLENWQDKKVEKNPIWKPPEYKNKM
jgi:hypothetical protein